MLTLSVIFFKVGKRLAKLQARTRLSCALSSSFSSLLARRAKMHVTTTLLLVTLLNIHQKNTYRLSKVVQQRMQSAVGLLISV